MKKLTAQGSCWDIVPSRKKIREQHQLAVPRALVYDVLTKVDPEGLERRRNVGRGKRKRGATGTFTSLVGVIIMLF